MPEQEEQQQSNLVQNDQETMRELAEQRRQDLMRNQAVDNDPDQEDESEGGNGDDDQEEAEQPEQEEQQPPSFTTYAMFGFFAFVIDVLVDVAGGFIFSAPITFALGILFKVPAYFFITGAGKKEKLIAKKVVLGVCAAISFLPGDNLATVLVSLFLDYKDKILKVAKFASKFAGPQVKVAVKAAEIANKAADQAQGVGKQGVGPGDGGGRWRPPQVSSGGKLQGVVAGTREKRADNYPEQIKKAG